MERKFLEELGLDKKAVDKIMAQHGKDIEPHKAAAENVAKDRDAYKGQLEEVSSKLQAFAGVDIEALRGEVEALKKDMAAKEAAYQTQLADRDFQALLTAGITEAKGKKTNPLPHCWTLTRSRPAKTRKRTRRRSRRWLSSMRTCLAIPPQTPPLQP